ncbi:MAG TPA: EAL domain-containing protein [Frankiaceae bacterium]|nr:EAL domain-containing protein [Frankiaceae bacterium]
MKSAACRPTLLVSAIATAVFVWTALLLFSPGSKGTAAVASNVGLIVAAAVGASACYMRSRRGGPQRRSWLLLGSGALSWGLGACAWTAYETLGRQAPIPSWADVGYLGAVPLLAAGLLTLPGTPVRWPARVRLLLDGALIAAALLAISWVLVLGPLINNGKDGLVQVFALAYPLGDIVCGSLAVVSLARAPHQAQVPLRTLLLVCLGLLSFSVGDTGFALLTLRDTYQSGQLIGLGWCGGWALLAVAALQPSGAPSEPSGENLRHRAWMSTSAPYVPLLAMVGILGVWRSTHGALGRIVVLDLLLMLLLVVVRHVLTQRENDQLTSSLEARVLDRTEALSGWEQWWKALVQNSTDIVTVVRADGTVRYQTPSVQSVFGYDAQDLLETDIADVFLEPDRHRLRQCLAAAALAPGEPLTFSGGVRHADGSDCATESTVMSLLHEDAVQGLVINTRDISERMQLESELNHRAFHDELSGLANRALFRDRLIHALNQRDRVGLAIGVLFIDLDRFKEVNDTLGHAYGDELLVVIARRLTELVRPGDSVARLGGDEFAVLLEHLTTPDEAQFVADRLVEVIAQPVHVREVDVRVRASIGITIAEIDDAELADLDAPDSADVMLRNGDIAMYRAKSAGGGACEWYRPELHTALLRRVEIEKQLRNALTDDELSLVYQPTASVATGIFTGVEALVRWDSRVLGKVLPNEFIPVAEDTGLIIDLGAWVLHHACVQAAVWLRNGVRADFTLAVNVSGLQLLSSGMVDTVRSALTLSGLPAENLLLEMTESVLLERTDQTLARLHELKRLGIRLAIDDFGTGYSSLSYLSRFPVDVLKVDRSFIAQLQQESSNERELTRTIIQLGGSLAMLTVAEGVETPEQLASLRALGCDLAQGYLFSEPRPPDEIEPMLARADDAPAAALPSAAALPPAALPPAAHPT